MHVSGKNSGKYGLFFLLLTVMVVIWGKEIYSFRLDFSVLCIRDFCDFYRYI